jgi:hypothetical protein
MLLPTSLHETAYPMQEKRTLKTKPALYGIKNQHFTKCKFYRQKKGIASATPFLLAIEARSLY